MQSEENAKSLTHLHCVQVQFSVDYEHRASIKLDRMAVINAVADLVPKVRMVSLQFCMLPLYFSTPCCWLSCVLGTTSN